MPIPPPITTVMGMRTTWIVALAFLTAAPIQAQTPTGKSLAQCYQDALKRSENVGVQDELLVQNNELHWQAIGAVLPQINATGTFLYQPPPESAANIYPSTQNTIKFTATQPLFRGLRDFAALRQKSKFLGSQKLALQNAARQLFYDVATAYYNVLSLQSDALNYQNETEVNRKRLKELEDFARIGRSRRSEVLTLKSNVTSLEAQIELTQGQLENAKETLAYLTGNSRDTLLSDAEVVPPSVLPLTEQLARIEERPDVKAAAANVMAYEEGVPITFGQHFPSVDVVGDYYALRPGVLQNTNWDVYLSVSLPIFSGGVMQSQVRQAASVRRQYELTLSQARRLAEQEIRQFYNSFVADQKQSAKLTETSDLSKQNYESELKDYRNGLVTNLEVLQSITTWQGARRLADRQTLTLKTDFVKLEAASARRKEIFIESERLPP